MLPHSTLVPIRSLMANDTPAIERDFIGRIRNELFSNMVSSAWADDGGEDSFLPTKALISILTHETVETLLRGNSETDTIKLSDIIGINRRREILATLILIRDGVRHIGNLINSGLCDKDLPIKMKSLRLLLDYTDAYSFYNYQYCVHVPVWNFSLDEIPYVSYGSRCILPFIEKQKISSGGQGLVWKVRIHEDHYRSRVSTVSKEKPQNISSVIC